jgi:hypothetical protein
MSKQICLWYLDEMYVSVDILVLLNVLRSSMV